MHANLVGPAGEGRTLQQAELAVGPGQAHPGLRRLAFSADDNVALAALAMRDQQWPVDEQFAELPVANHQRQVILFDDALPEFLVQRAQRAALLRNNEAARGLPVEPVHEGQVPEVRPRGP